MSILLLCEQKGVIEEVFIWKADQWIPERWSPCQRYACISGYMHAQLGDISLACVTNSMHITPSFAARKYMMLSVATQLVFQTIGRILLMLYKVEWFKAKNESISDDDGGSSLLSVREGYNLSACVWVLHN